MQFTMGEPSGEKIRSWESDFKDILAYLKLIEAPKYPLPIDRKLAAEGEQVFNKTCSVCHGSYGAGGKYPNKVIPLDVVGTDSLRLAKLTKEFRDYYKQSWFGKGGESSYEYPTGYARAAARRRVGLRAVFSQRLRADCVWRADRRSSPEIFPSRRRGQRV